MQQAVLRDRQPNPREDMTLSASGWSEASHSVRSPRRRQKYPRLLFLKHAFNRRLISPLHDSYFLPRMSEFEWITQPLQTHSRITLFFKRYNRYQIDMNTFWPPFPSIPVVSRHEVDIHHEAPWHKHARGGNWIRFNSSPVSRNCFYVLSKYLFSGRYVLRDAIFSPGVKAALCVFFCWYFCPFKTIFSSY